LRTLTRLTTLSLAVLFLLSVATCSSAQDEPKPPVKKIEQPKILDVPLTVDPATLVPKQLAAVATVDFTDSTLRKIASWIQQEQKIAVLFDNNALAAKGILLGEPVSDRLDGAPVYLLLNRLRLLGLSWYVQDDILHITTREIAESRMVTNSYNVSDLFDAGYQPDQIVSTVFAATNGDWAEVDGEGGSLEWLGDVLFVRHTDQVHRQVSGLISALRKHGRQTYSLDPPQHQTLRLKLNDNVSIQYANTPLFEAMADLGKQAKIDIRIDSAALRDAGIRDREPVSLALTDRKLQTVLRVLLANFNLTWVLRDGVMWITTANQAQAFRKTAVFDVRDLCRNRSESNELAAAIFAQTQGPWEEQDGEGGIIEFPLPGTLVIRQTDSVLREIQELLAAYRNALLSSKPREQIANKAKEVITRYYRLQETVARDLAGMLPQLVQPESWQSDKAPKAPGTILQLASGPQLLNANGSVVHAVGMKPIAGQQKDALVVFRVVLIIKQTRAAHKEIAEVIRRVENGDPMEAAEGKGGLGGGGFGGGFFSTK
jgi:hypothetical protein